MAFGGKLWEINTQDFVLAQNANGTDEQTFCLGGIFVLNVVTNVNADDLNPDWVVGDTFLVSNLSRLHFFDLLTCSFFFFFPLEKCVLGVPFHPTGCRI